MNSVKGVDRNIVKVLVIVGVILLILLLVHVIGSSIISMVKNHLGM